ncbi:hypothetical protein EV673_0848 [Limnobacter thiooxidans]|uniref:DUF4936 domain-containing protein n=1 Tax=Limnobacter thiooxidans TaxID=131080 RepID=A0AA86M8J7_9BURK|nr:DUF4936 family protein [Limnobacter sp.]MCZ8015426.1 hypothetical protein [Limnobacter sp.]RZS42511.1 hypothetical protein EV673_0848 [Limnobacter thiooxidans]BET26054.1 hypothetical protein RGQ30_15550 [Limnobacter thiooxidans]
MAMQLFVYYRIPKADIAQGLACAGELIKALEGENLGTAKLYQREEADKPYFTLMEVIEPAPVQSKQIADFCEKVQELAKRSFSTFENPPARHTEIFSEVIVGAAKPCA